MRKSPFRHPIPLALALSALLALQAGCADSASEPASEGVTTGSESTAESGKEDSLEQRCAEDFPLRSHEEALDIIEGGQEALDTCEDERMGAIFRTHLPGECESPPERPREVPEYCEALEEEIEWERACFNQYAESEELNRPPSEVMSLIISFPWYPDCDADLALVLAAHPTIEAVRTWTQEPSESLPGE